MLGKGFVKGKIKNQASLLELMAKNQKQTDPSTAEKMFRAGRVIDKICERVDGENGLNNDEKRRDLMSSQAETARFGNLRPHSPTQPIEKWIHEHMQRQA